MRLTLHTDYALRLLMLLATEPARRHTVEEVAQRYGISRNHLMKVAQTLVRSGFIGGTRGRGGGLQLARASQSINLGAVVRATEDGFALVECFDPPGNTCVIADECALRNPLDRAVRAFLAELDRYSLADLAKSPGTFRGLHRYPAIHDTEIRP